MMKLDIHPELKSQAIITSIEVKGNAKRVRFEFDYMEKPNKWFMSIYNTQSGESYVLNVPLVASYYAKNNLLAPYAYKDIGEVVCVPVVDEPSSVDPEGENLGEFAVIWGEEIA